MKAKSKYLLWVVIGMGGLLWAVYVWPTPWSHYKRGSNNLRVNRFTGGTQVLGDYGWADAKAPAPSYADTPNYAIKLNEAFPSPTPAQQSCIDKVRMGVRYGAYPDALAALDKLASDASLTEPQKKAINDNIEYMKAFLRSP